MKVEVRNNNVDKAIQIMKKKLQQDGLFNILREREFYESKGSKRRKTKAASIRRQQREIKKRKEELGY
ncbi:MAG: 30S ribosomal protein S21 [Candidatus Pelagibacter sp.]|jgi:small subunit ribosomal protein S21|nr:30S ribosomal protein S21 [Candidatus Pelagibacter sp.]MAJ66499.1 30S ribosomal protein S21 [Candidatus Pelagibacter sp.]OUW69966.1 MAG: 30S ribosomal protein S21 [Rickettsiales bacterium TMED211]OUW70697.1 MAG: 30S ribosomal protein S21 [Rickettsiales bacterium TMED211]|tara:strand:- start:109 stop:312 length:204 start_codon:yes stop_codon:yes gene_type:complete